MPAEEFRKWTREYERTQALLVSSDHEGEKIRDWWSRVPFEAWTYALEEAKDNRQTGRWKYIEAILARVEREGLPADKQVERAVTTVVKGLSVRELMQ
jgi:DNA replication protein DnaD